jgi:hypothetical protein
VPFDLSLPLRFRRARWKVKIREKETREPPHATILRGTKAWRINLRTREFMDAEPDPADVPSGLVTHIKLEKVWKKLCDEGDKKYPGNPVQGEREADDEQNDRSSS